MHCIVYMLAYLFMYGIHKSAKNIVEGRLSVTNITSVSSTKAVLWELIFYKQSAVAQALYYIPIFPLSFRRQTFISKVKTSNSHTISNLVKISLINNDLSRHFYDATNRQRTLLIWLNLKTQKLFESLFSYTSSNQVSIGYL